MAKRSFSPSDFPQAVSFAPHVLIDRKGNQWLGRILEPAFTIKTEFQTIVIKRKKIQSIVYKNEPTFEQDRLITLDGTVLNGVVRPPLRSGSAPRTVATC